jgi:hypothetical protein
MAMHYVVWSVATLAWLWQALPVHAQALDIPVVIQEALPDDVRQPGFQLITGLARATEPVTFGLPLPDSANIAQTSQLGLAGTGVGQFRVLSRWPSGNIQWLLVDTQADVAANARNDALRLVSGAGNFGGVLLATDLGSEIRVDTGTAQFHVRKAGFNLLDRANIGGTEILQAGASSGIELIGVDGTIYRAANDAQTQVSIEENGPARAVVVARGNHRSAGAARLLDYTVRMHFYRGKSRVRVVYTLRNAGLADVANREFRSLELVLASTLSAPNYRIATHNGENTGTLTSTDEIDLFLGENAYPNFRDYDFTDFDGQGNEITTRWPSTVRGYRLRRNGTQLLASGTREQYHDLAYAQLSDASRSIAVGTRFAAGLWPQALRADGAGDIRVGLFPVGNDRTYVARFSGHYTREVMLEFSAGGGVSGARDALFRAQYPLIGKAQSVDTYNRSGAIWEPILALDDEVSRYAARGWPTQELLARRPEFTLYRHYYWGTGGGNNQYDFTKIDLHNFLRRDLAYAGGYWLNAEQRLGYNADLAVYHSDDFDGAADTAPRFEQLPNADRIAIAKAVFEGEHRHAYGIPLMYYLSGDERLREAYLDWGDWMRHFQAAGFNDYERGLAWNIYNLIDLYRFSGNAAYRDLAWQFFDQHVLPAAQAGASAGTDYQRGFFIGRYATNNPDPISGRIVQSFILGAMFPRAYQYLHDYGALTAAQRDRVRDMLDGIARFVAHELWYEYPDGSGGLSVGNFGLVYSQSVDVVRNPPDARLEPNWFGGFKEAWNTFQFGYRVGGDTEFLRRGALLQFCAALNPESFNYYPDWPDRQRLQITLDGPESGPVWRDLPLSVQDLGAGAYQLAWITPAGAQEIWIKHSDRTIVSWLNFDRVTRQYQFPPAQFSAFFAAENIQDEPTPGSAGQTQTYAVGGLGSNRRFAARVLINASADRLFESGFE